MNLFVHFGSVMKYGHRLLIICLAMLGALSAAAAPVLMVMTDERQPLAWRDKTGARGISYDLVAATMKELGMEPEIHFTTFTRGLALAQTQPNQAFFSVTRSPERDATLKWVGPLVQNDIYVYKLKSSPAIILNLHDLRRLQGVGVPKGMSQDAFLTEQGLGNIMRSDTIANAIRALATKRIDAVAIGRLTFFGTVKELGLDVSLFEETPVKLFDNPLYIAFSRNVPDQEIQRWQKALNKVKREQHNKLSNLYLR